MKILIANRGCAATRIMRCCEKLNIEYTTVYSLDDAESLHVSTLHSVLLHPTSSTSLDTYLNADRIIDICKEHGCTHVHPGYGFLSENAEFAEQCEMNGIQFIGPTAEQIAAFGLKHRARALAKQFGVPVVPGTSLLDGVEQALTCAREIGYPVLLKCVAGGGGVGLKVCENDQDLETGFDSVRRLALKAFKNDGVFLEKYLATARHVEVQIFGDHRGNVVCLGDRDCTTQRRNQKIIEESPAPGLTAEVREKMWNAAVGLAKGVGYRSAGTVEFIVDARTLDFYFLEVNTRVQVEHGVTEQTCEEDIDIVEWTIKTSLQELDLSQFQYKPRYHAIQCRIYAEDANKDYQPSSNMDTGLTHVSFPTQTHDCRVEHWIKNGSLVSTMYDPMLAKLICRGTTRQEAIANLICALQQTEIEGLESNLEFLEQILMDSRFANFTVSTHWLNEFEYLPHSIDVLDPGAQTTIQDFPGRVGYWFAGVPPSGPMDSLAFRLANRLVGNAEQAAGLEMIQGTTQLKFNVQCYIALTGCEFEAQVDGQAVKFWQTIHIQRGQILTVKSLHSASGLRAYMAFSNGGLVVADYLGSKSTFALGKCGGLTLKHGDVLRLNKAKPAQIPLSQIQFPPQYSAGDEVWELHVTVGPHSDFFTREYFEKKFLRETFEVHYNSNRLGIRLIAQSKPEFIRLDGGEAGLHPSNIHDVVYAIGSVNFTGDLPVILGLDGPSLGGFVCPVTICQADLWKIGQIKPGSKLRFVVADFNTCVKQQVLFDEWIASNRCFTEDFCCDFTPRNGTATEEFNSILHEFTVDNGLKVVYRLAGDNNVLVEYGELKLDLTYRCRVHALQIYLESNPIVGVTELSPGVRSVQVKFDSRKITSLQCLLDALHAAEQALLPVENMEIPSRVIRLPLAFNASSTELAIAKYRQSVRDKAPWLPSNIDFIQRINGLDSTAQVQDVVFESKYLVLGLGDVYLGAPCAVPLDPRHRLQTTKYNPARTWTEEGEVGIGGVFMCIYGMQSPGGYQLVGRTVPVWKTFANSRNWLLQSFDQVQFYSVSEPELIQIRSKLKSGEMELQVTKTVFKVKEYQQFLVEHESEISVFQHKQAVAFENERKLWQLQEEEEVKAPENQHVVEQVDLSRSVPVRAQISGSVWSVHVKCGDFVRKGDLLVVVEAMKLEISVCAMQDGVVNQVIVRPGAKVQHGDLLICFESKPTLPRHLNLTYLQALYNEGYSVSTVMLALLDRLHEHKDKPLFISTFEPSQLLQRAKELDELKQSGRIPLPKLFGVPFAVKDNIDVVGLPTTCACPDFAYQPELNAFSVQLAIDAGGLCIGKTNMDQFAAGLVGVRSPYGIPSSVFNQEYVSGGSSSGSAVCVALGLCTFSLGTDTAGSGRVPAMFNNLVGLKPSRGLISNTGLVPACQSLDCISIFATNLDDAEHALEVLAQFDLEDPYSRQYDAVQGMLPHSFTFAIPEQPKFFNDTECERMFYNSVQRLEGMGGIAKRVPFDVFEQAAQLLYGPWVAERLEALQSFFADEANDIHPVTKAIIAGGSKITAVDMFSALHKLEKLKSQAKMLLQGIDVLVVPTAPTHYKIADVVANPVQLNSNLGTYTNFVNLMDMSALAVPTQEFCVGNGMPFGITFIGRAMCDAQLLALAKRFEQAKTADLAVCGAHLSNMPLNPQLQSRGCILVKKTATARGKYTLFALSETRPGLVRRGNAHCDDDDDDSQIEVEVWRFPNLASFGDFVSNMIPSPLCVGKLELADGSFVTSFLCEESATCGALDITKFGGWRNYKQDLSKA